LDKQKVTGAQSLAKKIAIQFHQHSASKCAQYGEICHINLPFAKKSFSSCLLEKVGGENVGKINFSKQIRHCTKRYVEDAFQTKSTSRAN